MAPFAAAPAPFRVHVGTDAPDEAVRKAKRAITASWRQNC